MHLWRADLSFFSIFSLSELSYIRRHRRRGPQWPMRLLFLSPLGQRTKTGTGTEGEGGAKGKPLLSPSIPNARRVALSFTSTTVGRYKFFLNCNRDKFNGILGDTLVKSNTPAARAGTVLRTELERVVRNREARKESMAGICFVFHLWWLLSDVWWLKVILDFQMWQFPVALAHPIRQTDNVAVASLFQLSNCQLQLPRLGVPKNGAILLQ